MTAAAIWLRARFHQRWFGAALLSMLCVLVLTHIPQEAVPRALQHNLFDKVEHVAAYGLTAYLFMRAVRRPWSPLLPILVLTLIMIGALDEVTQPLVNRYASMVDFIADVAGIGTGSLISLVRRWPERHTLRA